MKCPGIADGLQCVLSFHFLRGISWWLLSTTWDNWKPPTRPHQDQVLATVCSVLPLLAMLPPTALPHQLKQETMHCVNSHPPLGEVEGADS